MEPKVKFQNETFETLRIKMKTALHKNFKIMKTIPNVRVFANSHQLVQKFLLILTK